MDDLVAETVMACQDLRELVADIRACYATWRHDVSVAERIEAILQPWVENPNWIEPKHCQCQTDEDIYPLYEGAADDVLICVICWKQGAPGCIHDHNTWAVVGVAQGEETHHFYQRADNGASDEQVVLRSLGQRVLKAGDTVSLDAKGIHQVCNSSDLPATIGIHVYGAHLEKNGRYKYDLAAGRREKMYCLK
jgi:predicted metal-dependent enzyme (double-stranded beta helix superfamily)